MRPRGNTRTLYVGGFGSSVGVPALRALFARFGEVEDLRLVDRGEASFAYVTFTAESHAWAARQQLDGARLAGRVLRVELAQ